MPNPLAPPPPTGNPIDRWLYLLWRKLTATGQLFWSSIVPGTSADVAEAVTDETGSPGSLVFSGNPTLDGATIGGASSNIAAGAATLFMRGGQIGFPSTQVSSTDPNTLDDYEEGTWTPVMTFATPGNLSVTYSVQQGYYTKIGRVVHLISEVVSSAFTHTTAAGNLQITGIPFAASSDTQEIAIGSSLFAGVNKAGYSQCVSAIAPGNSYIELRAQGMGVASGNVLAADTPTGGTMNLRFGITYFT